MRTGVSACRVTFGRPARCRASAATMSWANSTPPVSIQKARSTPCASSCGKRRGSSSSGNSFIDLPMPANAAAERSAQVSPLPVSASVPVAA